LCWRPATCWLESGQQSLARKGRAVAQVCSRPGVWRQPWHEFGLGACFPPAGPKTRPDAPALCMLIDSKIADDTCMPSSATRYALNNGDTDDSCGRPELGVRAGPSSPAHGRRLGVFGAMACRPEARRCRKCLGRQQVEHSRRRHPAPVGGSASAESTALRRTAEPLLCAAAGHTHT
jgi:hypothetical protein